MMGADGRAVVLFGAGASLEYGAPCTAKLTETIKQAVLADRSMQACGAASVYTMIEKTLRDYLKRPGVVHFEQIFHCAHELIYSFKPNVSAVDEFRPILAPFLCRRFLDKQETFTALVSFIAEIIFREVSACCGRSPISLNPLTAFIAGLRRDHNTRLYTTNYDDFALQAVPDLYTGYDRVGAAPYRFDLDQFWARQDEDSLFHLHGSVHMAYRRPPVDDFAELVWFDDLAQAVRHSPYTGGRRRRMDGGQTVYTAIITGFDKLGRLQQRPLSHYYAAMIYDLMRSDVIYVMGSGLGDLHLNSLIHEARSRNPPTPLIFVDCWKNGFWNENLKDPPDRKTIELFHDFKVHIGSDNPGTSPAPGWTVSQDKTAAVWDKGFQNFLNAPSDLATVLNIIT
jgi:hypothetical protein